MQMRRIVTGHTPEGKSTFMSDTILEGEARRIWGADEAPCFPSDGSEPQPSHFFPPIGGFRFVYVTLPSASKFDSSNETNETVFNAEEDGFLGIRDHMEPDNPGMHTSDTIDFVYVISGEVWLELDDSEEVLIKAGDTVIENGTRHRWNNRSSEPCVILGCMIGAKRA